MVEAILISIIFIFYSARHENESTSYEYFFSLPSKFLGTSPDLYIGSCLDAGESEPKISRPTIALPSLVFSSLLKKQLKKKTQNSWSFHQFNLPILNFSVLSDIIMFLPSSYH